MKRSKSLQILCLMAVLLVFTQCSKTSFKVNPESEEEHNFKWKYYSTANSALPDNFINSIAFDEKNNIKWVGTSNGLVRINGNNWKVYTMTNSLLPSSFISALSIDENGKLWVGTDKGLVSFDGINWQVFTDTNSILKSNGITSIVHDSTNLYTWVGTEKGLVRIGRSNWDLFDENNNLFVEHILSLAIGKNGKIWIGAFDHFRFRGMLYSYDGIEWKIEALDKMGYPSMFPIALSAEESGVWLGMRGTTPSRLVHINSANWKEVETANIFGLSAIALQNNHIWVGGRGIGTIEKTPGQRWQSVIINNENPINVIAIQNDGTKWIGTSGGGLIVGF